MHFSRSPRTRADVDPFVPPRRARQDEHQRPRAEAREEAEGGQAEDCPGEAQREASSRSRTAPRRARRRRRRPRRRSAAADHPSPPRRRKTTRRSTAKAAKENDEGGEEGGARAAKAAKAAKDNKEAEEGVAQALRHGKAAAVAAAALKRPAGQFVVDEDPSSRGSFHKHEGGRPAKRQARAMLHSRFDAAATPGSPDVMTEHVPARWPEEDAAPAAGGDVPVKERGAKKIGCGSKDEQLASAATAAAAAAKNARAVAGREAPRRARGWRVVQRIPHAAGGAHQAADQVRQAEGHEAERSDGRRRRRTARSWRITAPRLKSSSITSAGSRPSSEGSGGRGGGASSRAYELERENAELKEISPGASREDAARGAGGGGGDAARGGGGARRAASGRWGSEELEAFMGLELGQAEHGRAPIHPRRHRLLLPALRRRSRAV